MVRILPESIESRILSIHASFSPPTYIKISQFCISIISLGVGSYECASAPGLRSIDKSTLSLAICLTKSYPAKIVVMTFSFPLSASLLLLIPAHPVKNAVSTNIITSAVTLLIFMIIHCPSDIQSRLRTALMIRTEVQIHDVP